MEYRFFLLDKADHFRVAVPFIAQDDREAREIALFVGNAVADKFDGYELWRGSVCVTKHRPLHLSERPLSAAEIAQERQMQILDLEDSLQRSFECVRDSRRLLQTMTGMVFDLRAASREPSDAVN